MENQRKKQRVSENVIPSIAMNTFKGGVSKTTTTYNLAWCIAKEYDVKVLVVDMDPQRNLTQIFLECDQVSEETRDTVFRDSKPTDVEAMVNIGEALTAVLSDPTTEQCDVEAVVHPLCKNLFLLPGSLAVTDYEEELASSEISQSTATRYVPAVLNKVVQATARTVGAQLIIMDTSPSMGCLNMLVVMTSTYFVVPCQTDYFSLKAVELLRKRMFENAVGNKGTWLDRVQSLKKHSASTSCPLPVTLPKFLGVILQMFSVRKGRIVQAHAVFVDKVSEEVQDRLVPSLREHGMCFSAEENAAARVTAAYEVARIRNFNRFAPMAQEQGLPIYALLESGRIVAGNDKDLSGTALDTAIKDLKKLIQPIRSAAQSILLLIQLPDVEVPIRDPVQEAGEDAADATDDAN